MMAEATNNPRQTMWQMLAHTIVENIDGFHLDRILGMVKKNLTFDDPGLFSAKLLIPGEERERERTANTWLINQLVYSLSICSNVKSIQNNVALQKEILSASIMKQSWFFTAIGDHYIEFLIVLLTVGLGSELQTFTSKSFAVERIDPSCAFRTIKVPNESKKQQLLQNTMRVLTHAMILGNGTYGKLFQKCTQTVLQTFDSSDFGTRLSCIEYMAKLLYNTSRFDIYIINSAHRTLQGTWIMCEKLPIWLETDCITRNQVALFTNCLGQFFKSLRPLRLSSHSFKLFIKLHIQHLSSLSIPFYKQNDIPSIELQGIILKNITILFGKQTCTKLQTSLVRDLEGIVINSPQCIRALEICILEDLKGGEGSSEVFELSPTWIFLHGLLLDSLTFINSNRFEPGMELEKRMKMAIEILKVVNSVECYYILHHQMMHFLKKYPCQICGQDRNTCANYGNFDGELTKIDLHFFWNNLISEELRSFVEMLMQLKTVGEDDYCILIDLANSLIKNKIICNLSSNQQIRLIDLICQSIKDRFEIRLRTPSIVITEVFSVARENLQLKSVSILFNSDIKSLSLEAEEYLKSIVKDLIRQIISEDRGTHFETILITSILHMMTVGLTSVQFTCEDIVKTLLTKSKQIDTLYVVFKSILCIVDGNAYFIGKIDGYCWKYITWCPNCDTTKYCICNENDKHIEQLWRIVEETQSLVVFQHVNKDYSINKSEFQNIFTCIKEQQKLPIEFLNGLPSYLAHLDYNPAWIQLFSYKDLHVRLVFSSQITAIVSEALKKPRDVYHPILRGCIRELLNASKESLNEHNRQTQAAVLNMIAKISLVENIPEDILLHLFRMTFLFFIRKESCVSYEAALCAQEMCTRRGITPRNLLNWYKQEVLGLIITLCVSIFLRNGTELNKAINFISKMLGFGGPRDFIAKNYKLIFAMLLPWCIKYPKTERLLEEVSATLQKDLSTCLTASFLTIYPYLFLNETFEVNKNCIQFVIHNTGSSLYKLLHSDIKRTVAEILIYYHKNPASVMKAFRYLILKDIDESSTVEMPHSKVAEYIATRFLGVLTFFESCLLDPDFEKALKVETLLSFGEIMRFIGSTHVTPFRFKILAMLRTALTIDDVNLKKMCVNIWNIFVHTVDIQALGPLLGTVVVSLEPLLSDHSKDVSSIYRYLIISNGSLLSLYIPELYFIEEMGISSEIKEFVQYQTEKRRGKSFMEQFTFFLNQIGHENPVVRVYGLNHLITLFSSNRSNLNNLIMDQNILKENAILERLLQNLMIGCCHNDVALQLISGKCLGELGAIEPSHLPPNYVPQRNFALSIHTDAFAIMALEELCRAYQFQKDTKYVDSFSLAIQEILLARGVCPKLKKKMEVWEAIPERMRQLMEPLLTSCYTGLKMTTNIRTHPVFGSAKCQTAEEWAFIWASKMIEKVQDAETFHLLNSFKPSIKRDANTLGLFLPYIVLHTLQSSDTNTCENIYEELQCVLEAAESQRNVSLSDFTHKRQRGLKTLQFIQAKNLNKTEDPTEHLSVKCAKIAFEQLDFLERWIREWRRVYLGHTPDTNFIKVDSFVKRFEKKLIARANFNCNEYARALMYLEAHIEENPATLLEESLSLLAEIYAELINPDSLEGAISLKKTELTLSEQILVNNMTDRLTESTACFEQLMQYEDIHPNQICDIVQCYLRLDTPETALLVSEGLLNQLGEKYMDDSLRAIQAEPLWRLGRFDQLEKLFGIPEIRESNSWGVQCGQALLCFRKNDFHAFNEKIKSIRLNALNILKTGGIEQNSYQKGYQYIMTLHLISEIEKTKSLSNKLCSSTTTTECLSTLEYFFDDWNSRLALLQPIPRIKEPVLCLRRILLGEMMNILQRKPKSSVKIETVFKTIEDEIAKMWIQSSKLARTAGLFQQAQLCIMNAQKLNPHNLFTEKAKMLWKKGDQTSCFKVLEQKIDEIVQTTAPSQSIQSLPKATRLLYAEAKFLQATYNAESMNISTDMNLKYFKESLIGNPKSEKCLVHLAQYLDRIFSSMSEIEQENQGREILVEIMKYYGKSMSYGCEFIYQSMPRILSVWLDFTAKTRKDENFRKLAFKMNEIVERFSNELPLFVFFTAFSQLVSRICHPYLETYNVLKTTIVKLIEKFPQQSLWLILSVFKSSYSSRVKRCTEIFNDPRLSAKLMQKLISDFNSLAEKMIELTNKEIPSTEKNPRVSSLVRHLPKLFSMPDFSQIIMPFQQFTQPILPPINARSNPASGFDAFPNKYVYMSGIKEEIVVLLSLQRPRKVVLIGSDGKGYTIMLKPKDDLRKDFRLMEFDAVVKQYLHQDPDARHRRLGIRTYAVIPLNEECGLIEWLHNLQAFRQILMGFYKQRHLGMNTRELRDTACKVDDPEEKKREVFLTILVPRHPPVFGEWFRYRFTTPYNWYQARCSYIKTLAVMSIVGYILGLGDRHGENILFDSTNGDAVHVDFNCLFNKGETFECPEKVPFRLTHNMVHAMGALGIEGLYRKCCEITMRVLRAQTTTLMSVLRPFVYDPLLTWSRNVRTDMNTERTDNQAMANLKRIEERLKCFVRIKGCTTNMPLSVEGHVNFVIQEASDIDNLAAMYIGWGSYL